MSFTTFFQHTYTSLLPLPPIREKNIRIADAPDPETLPEIKHRGLKTALSLLHDPETMISLNPLVINFSRLPPTPEYHPRLVDIERLAQEFNVPIPQPTSPSLPTTSLSLSVHTFSDSRNGEFVHYEITDRFPFLFGTINKQMSYRACFRPLFAHGLGLGGDGSQSIGCETISDPGNGVSLLGKWTVEIDEKQPGYLVLTETVKVHCNVFVGWYVKSQLEGAHEQLHKEFGRRFVERMVAEDPGVAPSVRAKQLEEEKEQEVRKTMSQQRREEDIAPVQRVHSGGSIKDGMKMRLEVGKSKKKEEDIGMPTVVEP